MPIRQFQIRLQVLKYIKRSLLFLQRLQVHVSHAKSTHDKALKVRPKDHYSLYNKGFSFYHLGEYMQAVKWYDKLLKIDPQGLDATYNKALALHDLGKYDEALIWYDKALRIDPKDKETIEGRNDTIIELENK